MRKNKIASLTFFLDRFIVLSCAISFLHSFPALFLTPTLRQFSISKAIDCTWKARKLAPHSIRRSSPITDGNRSQCLHFRLDVVIIIIYVYLSNAHVTVTMVTMM
jgi:hypothetical protein